MSSITVRLDEGVKTEATDILEGLGLDLSSAIRSFIYQVVLRRGLPFAVTYPETDETFDRLRPEIQKRMVAGEERMKTTVTGTGYLPT